MGLKETFGRVKDAIQTLLPASTQMTEPVQEAEPVPTSVSIDHLTDEYLKETENGRYWDVNPQETEAGSKILGLPLDGQVAALHYVMDRIGNEKIPSVRGRLETLRDRLFSRNLPYRVSDLERLLKAAEKEINNYDTGYVGMVLRQIEHYQSSNPLTSNMRSSLTVMYEANRGRDAKHRKLKVKIGDMLGISGAGEPDSGEAWADAALAELNAMEPARRTVWNTLLAHAATADGGKPSGKWMAEAGKAKMRVGESEVLARVTDWFLKAVPPAPLGIAVPQLAVDANDPSYQEIYTQHRREVDAYYQRVQEYLNEISEKNLTLLKGLAWYTSTFEDAPLARATAQLADKAFQNIPPRGAWSKTMGNAMIWSLGQMPNGIGVGPLARLRMRIKDRAALKMIASAIEAAAAKSGMTVDELEDLAVPTGGLGADGTRQEIFGEEGSATLQLDSATGHLSLSWFGADGKPRKAIPAGIKKEFAAEVKALKCDMAEISQALTTQSARFDKFFLLERTWPLAVWRDRYLSHPVLGNLTRRLLWTFDGTPGLPVGETVVDASSNPLAGLTDDTIVRLWHPLGSTPQEVMRWRDTLEAHGIVQPFKQAHREVYLLTDAERNTRTYSNRFAAHILKQHQFNSLCALRGWKNSLRLMVDDSYPPATRELPLHNLRAEFWIEGIGEDYGVDTNETGTYLRVATDQVRFYRPEAPENYAHAYGGGYAISRRETPIEPLPLEEVPPLIFSEIMRDVDMFVGVASVGNDPTWADGGPEGRFRNYWQDYAFGDLGETAKTRSDVLARLLPRLKIASRCRLDGKFLVVQGQLRTYKIHLGSGNILMEPNDQYLCIVPSSRTSGDEGGTGDLFLPFEGDRMLAIILSKAFLLADDMRITDPTITRQIGVK